MGLACMGLACIGGRGRHAAAASAGSRGIFTRVSPLRDRDGHGRRIMTRPVKRSTSVDVARAAGVSRTTVSYVLNDRPGESIPEETRRRVLESAERLGYRPRPSARTLAGGRSDIVAVSYTHLRAHETRHDLV